MKFVVDESVSYAVVKELRKLGYEVTSICENPHSGIEDEKVYQLAVKGKAVLITRDFHFTNSLRFSPKAVSGIVYIRIGNLHVEEEVSLITKLPGFIESNKIEGKLITLYRDSIKVR